MAKRNQPINELDLSNDEVDGLLSNVRWPESTKQMNDILIKELQDAGIENYQAVALSQLHQICKAFGGVQFYLPSGKQLDAEIKRLSIWNDFKGNNVYELSRKYQISMQHVWRVIAEMRKRETKKRQNSLFDD